MKALILAGEGLNCEQETAEAFRLAGFEPEIRFIADLIAEHVSQTDLVERYPVLAIPGGFSFGDDLSSGKVLALKIKHGLRWNLAEFAEKGGLVLGVCNGFQALIRLGVFGRGVSITHNREGRFVDNWVSCTPQGAKSVWLKGLGTLELPVRHGEGRLVFDPSLGGAALERLERQGSLCLLYEQDFNGSEHQVAGLCDASGRILGLMPHPEAFVRWTQSPRWTEDPERASAPGQGVAIFENAYRACQKG